MYTNVRNVYTLTILTSDINTWTDNTSTWKNDKCHIYKAK